MLYSFFRSGARLRPQAVRLSFLPMAVKAMAYSGRLEARRTLGTTTAFAGNILALTSITLNTGANIQCGRALARNGAVTLDTNDVSIDTAGCETAVGGITAPEPGTAPLLALGLFLGAIVYGRQLQRRPT
jgi:hypothetical protein